MVSPTYELLVSLISGESEKNSININGTNQFAQNDQNQIQTFTNDQENDKYNEEKSIVQKTENDVREQQTQNQFDQLFQGFIHPSLLQIQNFWQNSSPIVAKILAISDVGLVSINFDKSIVVREIDEIDKTAININIVPNKNAQNDIKEKLKKFVWKCIKFEKNLIQIQINFNNPSYVSYEGLDKITVQIINQKLFKAQSEPKNGRSLRSSILESIYLPHRYTMVKSLPKQFQDKQIAENMKKAVEMAQGAVSQSFVLTICTNSLLAGSISLIWGFVNALQMIMNLPICEIGFPPNVALLYNIMLPLASLDIIPPKISTDLIFEFSDDQDKPFNQRLEEMGYENHNAIQNIGSMIYFMAITIFLLIVSMLLSIKIINCKFCLKLKTKLGIYGLLATLYMCFFEGFLEILISSYLSQKGAVNINSDDKFSFCVSIVFPIILFSVVPAIQVYVLYKSDEELQSSQFATRYHHIYPKLNFMRRSAIAYQLIYLFRRFIFVIIMFSYFMRNFLLLQIQCLIYLNASALIYLMYHKPFLGKAANRLEIFNEITIFIATECMLMYTSILDPASQFTVGWISVSAFAVCMVLNLSIMIFQTGKKAKLSAIRLYKKIKKRFFDEIFFLEPVDEEKFFGFQEKELELPPENKEFTLEMFKIKNNNLRLNQLQMSEKSSFSLKQVSKLTFVPNPTFADKVYQMNILQIERNQQLEQEMYEDIFFANSERSFGKQQLSFAQKQTQPSNRYAPKRRNKKPSKLPGRKVVKIARSEPVQNFKEDLNKSIIIQIKQQSDQLKVLTNENDISFGEQAQIRVNY